MYALCQVVAANNCDHFGDGDDPDWAMYGETNGIVVLKPCVGGYVDKERYVDTYLRPIFPSFTMPSTQVPSCRRGSAWFA